MQDTIYAKGYKPFLKNTGKSINGKFISITADYIGSNTVKITAFHIHNGKNMKIFVSLIPLFIVFILFLKWFRFDKYKFIFIRK